MQRLGLDELRAIQLSIMDDVHRFCVSNGLRYSICGGTLLGAVRHQGFIPWDDDMDMWMPRKDYDIFCKTYTSEDNYLLDLSLVEGCTEQFVKICRKGTIMEDVVLKRRIWGVHIDVFPLDGLPEDYTRYTDNILKIHNRILRICPYYKVTGRNRLVWFIKYCLKRLIYFTPHNILYYKKLLTEIAHGQLPEDSPLSTVIYGDFVILPFNSDMVLNHFEEILFEGRFYHCIQDRDTFLKALYNDYMTLPPIEKRVAPHSYDAYLTD